MKKIEVEVLNLNFGKREEIAFNPVKFEFEYSIKTTINDLYKYMLKNILQNYMEEQYYNDLIKNANSNHSIWFIVDNVGYQTDGNVRLNKLIKILKIKVLKIQTSFYTGGDGHRIFRTGDLKFTMKYNENEDPHVHVWTSSRKEVSVNIETGDITGRENLTVKQERKIRKIMRNENYKKGFLKRWNEDREKVG